MKEYDIYQAFKIIYNKPYINFQLLLIESKVLIEKFINRFCDKFTQINIFRRVSTIILF